MVTGLPKHITVRRAFERIRCQADAVIESIEQEATEAALALGLDVRSREKLMDALAREKGVWEWQHGGRCCSYLDDHRQSAPREDDRAVCVMMISQLITARDYIGSSFLDWSERPSTIDLGSACIDIVSACDDIDDRLKVLRCRLPRVTAA